MSEPKQYDDMWFVELPNHSNNWVVSSVVWELDAADVKTHTAQRNLKSLIQQYAAVCNQDGESREGLLSFRQCLVSCVDLIDKELSEVH